VGVIELFSRDIQPPDAEMMRVLMNVGTQISQFIERKTAEGQHRLGEARLRAILDNSPAVMHLKDTQGRYVLINRRFEQLFHLRREDIIGKSSHDLFPQESAHVLRDHDQQVMSALTPLGTGLH
jgi:PAS domain-containing protein